jgi:hypothetical protein
MVIGPRTYKRRVSLQGKTLIIIEYYPRVCGSRRAYFPFAGSLRSDVAGSRHPGVELEKARNPEIAGALPGGS